MGQNTEARFSAEIVKSACLDLEIELSGNGNLISLQCCALSFMHVLDTR